MKTLLLMKLKGPVSLLLQLQNWSKSCCSCFCTFRV